MQGSNKYVCIVCYVLRHTERNEDPEPGEAWK